MSIDRRSFLKSTGMGITMMSLTGVSILLSPSEAYAKNAPLKILTQAEATTLSAFAEVILPGCTEKGVVHYIDEMLSRDPNDSLLIARYFQVEPPYSGFYKGAIATLDGYCRSQLGAASTELSPAQRDELVASLFNIGPDGPVNPEGWMGPPAALFYMCVRMDAVDVVYGTMEGFANVNVPYMAHIEPPSQW